MIKLKLSNQIIPFDTFTVKIQSIILSSKNTTISSILHRYPSFDISSVAKFFDTLLIQITKEGKLNIVQLVKDFFDNLFLDIHFFEKKNQPFKTIPTTIKLCSLATKCLLYNANRF